MKRLLLILVSMIFWMSLSSSLYAWPQATHEQINYEAIKDFREATLSSSKYERSPLDIEKTYEGLEAISAAKTMKYYEDQITSKTYGGWIVHGGYSADETHLYEGVRHFYDPLTLSTNLLGYKVNYLTDQSSMHVWVSYKETGETPTISALEWGLTHPDNPFTFEKAKEYYRKSMSIAEDSQPMGVESNDLFRLSDIEVGSLEEERNVYLGLAFRALGETMHLLADMTVPAHVRNDGHALFDPLEERIGRTEVRKFQDGPIDPRTDDIFSEESDTSYQEVENLFMLLALYTNRYYFSDDTIYDQSMGIMPRNGEANYPSPQLSDLNKVDIVLDAANNRTMSLYTELINGKEVTLAGQSLYSVLFEDEAEYGVSPEAALMQGEVLVPIAIKACSVLINRFFPTIELVAKVSGEETLQDTKGREYVAYTIEANMIHHYEEDPDWDLEEAIRYSGPGWVVIEKDGKAYDQIPVNFDQGSVVAIEKGNAMIEQPLVFYVKTDASAKLDKEDRAFEVTSDMTLYLAVDAGGRHFTSEPIALVQPEMTFEITYEPKMPVNGQDVRFETQEIEGKYYQWAFGDDLYEVGIETYNPIHVYEETGTYVAQLQVFEDSNYQELLGAGSVEVEVDSALAMELLPSASLEASINDVVELAVGITSYTGIMPNYQLEWETSGGQQIELFEDRIHVQYSETGIYPILVRAVDDLGNELANAQGQIEIVEPLFDPYKKYDSHFYEFDYDMIAWSETPQGMIEYRHKITNRIEGMQLHFYDEEKTQIYEVAYYLPEVGFAGGEYYDESGQLTAKSYKYPKDGHDYEDTYLYQDGMMIREMHMVDGQRDGHYINISINTSDQTYVMLEENYKLGKLDGLVQKSHPTPIGDEPIWVEIAHYLEGQLHGERQQFYADGRLSSIVSFDQGQQNGQSKAYGLDYTTGVYYMRYSGNYDHDRPIGKHESYIVLKNEEVVISAEYYYRDTGYLEAQKTYDYHYSKYYLEETMETSCDEEGNFIHWVYTTYNSDGSEKNVVVTDK